MKKKLSVHFSSALVIFFFVMFCSNNNQLSSVTLPMSENALFVDAVNGNDSTATGTPDHPYKTIDKLWPRLAGGDTVYLANGNYPKIVAGRTWPKGSADLSWNCTPIDEFSFWVTIIAIPGQNPHIASLDLGTWNATPSHNLPFSQKGNSDVYLRFEGLTIDDGVSIMASRHVEVRNCRIHRIGELVGSTDVMNNKTGVSVVNGQYVTIENNDISHVAIGVSAMTTDFVLRGNNIHDNSHDGMRIYGGDNLLIERNQFHDLDDGMDGDGSENGNMHVDGIHIFINNYADKMATDLNGLTIRGNSFYHLESMGIMMNASSPPTTNYRNITFENNIMGTVGGNLLHWGARIEGFIFRHNTVVYSPIVTWTSTYRTLPCINYNVSWWPDGNGKLVYNNIFVDGKSSQPNPGDSSFSLIANNLYKTAPGRPLQRGEAVFSSLPYVLSDWTGALLPACQAVDAGTRLDANNKFLSNQLNFDSKDLPRDNRPDIGACEIQGRNPVVEK
jgi:hypothetical protein